MYRLFGPLALATGLAGVVSQSEITIGCGIIIAIVGLIFKEGAPDGK